MLRFSCRYRLQGIDVVFLIHADGFYYILLAAAATSRLRRFGPCGHLLFRQNRLQPVVELGPVFLRDFAHGLAVATP